ncbi:MAG TPA: CHASE2 domain-containing protein [Eoetvoesiella sp.]
MWWPIGKRNKGLSQVLEQRIHIEWVVVSLVLVLLTLSISYFDRYVGLDRVNQAVYDRTLSAAVKTPAADDIVIIAIDDDSIGQMGYWPWRRAVHAQLLGQLSQAKAVGLDIIFNDSNPAYPNDDQWLAKAIAAQGRVVLPLLSDKNDGSLSMPLPVLAQAARRIGSINIYPDDDAVVRSVVLQDVLPSGITTGHFILGMLDAAGEEALALKLKQQEGSSALLISYAGRAGSFTMYPYTQVLNGDIPASVFSGKYVLIGSWASGLGDYFPTSLSEDGESMAGVEILANGLQNALRNDWIHTPNRWQSALLSTLPVLLVCLVLRRFSPRRSFFISAVVLLVIFAGNWLLISYANFWVPSAASLVGVGLTYPVWSWRSQEAALQHFDRELQKLNDGQLPYIQTKVADDLILSDGSLSARVIKLHHAISLLHQAVRQREEVLRFISHDMRSPQNSILALTQLQNNSQAPLLQGELLARIDQYANTTLALVDSFVQLARAESMEMEYCELDLVDLLATTCDERWPLAQQRSSVIAFVTQMDCAYVNADGGMLSRAFGNLLDNAVNYSPAGSRIECRLSREGNELLVAVQDQGRGLSPAQQASLFTPFRRFEQNPADNPAGSGLGLAFVRTVVERHKGVITVQSVEGEGSTFSVRLAMADVD